MIEETGKVAEVRGQYAWIATEPQTGCRSCSAQRGCGTSVLAKVLGQRTAPVRVINSIGVTAGDRVVIGISESGLVRGSLAVYCMPLAGLFAGAVTGYYLVAGSTSAQADLASIAGAVAGFAAGLAWLRTFSRKLAQDSRYQPVLLRQMIAIAE